MSFNNGTMKNNFIYQLMQISNTSCVHVALSSKTTQQSNSHLNLGFFQAAKKVGPSNLFNGILSRSSSIIISVTLMSWMKEQLEHYCASHNELSSNNNNLSNRKC